jgi:glycosyltransferase involved in cell wall biosynthesis
MIYITTVENKSTGYTQASMNYMMSLYKAEEDFTVFPIKNVLNWKLMPFWAEPLSTWTGKSGVSRDIGVYHHLPDALPTLSKIHEKKSIAITTFETDKLPRWMIDSLNKSKFDLFLTPSDFNTEILRKSIEAPVYTLPHAIGDWWWNDSDPLTNESDERPYTFLYAGAWNGRKNPEMVLDAYLDAFPTETGDTCLAIKTLKQESFLNKLSSKIKDRTDVFVYHQMFNEKQMKWFHKMADCYVSAHRGEGFGLGLLQSKLLGRPCIYTDWSAPKEFCNQSRDDIAIEYEMKAISKFDQEHMHFQTDDDEVLYWAEPSYDHLVASMRDAYKRGRSNYHQKEWLAELRNLYSWENVGNMFKDYKSMLS